MYLGQKSEIIIKLYESGMYEYEGIDELLIPASGIEYDDLIVKLWKQGQTALEVHPIVATDWVELGNGLYILRLPETVFDTVGNMLVSITSPMIREASKEFFIEPQPVYFHSTPNRCLVTGNIIDMGADPTQGSIVFTLISIPMKVGNSLVSAEVKKTIPDGLGNFAEKLIRGAKVRVQIDSVGINHQIYIPDVESISLIELLPPL